MGDEWLEVFAVVGGQRGLRHDGRGGDHGVHPQAARLLQRAEDGGRNLRLGGSERKNSPCEQSKSQSLILFRAAAQEFIPGNRRDAEKFSGTEPLLDGQRFRIRKFVSRQIMTKPANVSDPRQSP